MGLRIRLDEDGRLALPEGDGRCNALRRQGIDYTLLEHLGWAVRDLMDPDVGAGTRELLQDLAEAYFAFVESADPPESFKEPYVRNGEVVGELGGIEWSKEHDPGRRKT